MSEPRELELLSSTVHDVVARMQRTRDALTRARLGSELIRDLVELQAQVADERRAAIEEAIDSGMTASDVAQALGLTKGRVSQIRSSRQ